MVILGASGDLTKRKLIPALNQLHRQGLLPERYAVLGCGRSGFSSEKFRESFKNDKEDGPVPDDDFLKKLHYVSFNTNDPKEYAFLADELKKLHSQLDIPENRIFYMATPPSLYHIIPEGLSCAGLNVEAENCWLRVVVEKPFGSDLQSAQKLNKVLQDFFSEDQIFRIDHYLGKESVQNIMVTRFANGIFEPLWNRNYIHHVEITSAEKQGVGRRGEYYDTAGALRDMVQNHLLQIVAIIGMEPPAVNSPDAIRNEILKVLQALKAVDIKNIGDQVIRGQYLESSFNGATNKAYRHEEHVSKDSRTETYVAMKLFIENWRWGGVPFYIRTGKRLPTDVTEAVIHFKPTPHKLYCFSENELNHDNQLVIRIQPDEGILFKFGMKIPGLGFRVQQVNMDFHYSDLGEQVMLDAYQQLLLDCMNNDATLYTRADAVEEAWRFIDPVLKYWNAHPDYPLHGYPSGTWGPKLADNLIEGDNLTWRYPCKNLANDGIYCEL